MNTKKLKFRNEKVSWVKIYLYYLKKFFQHPLNIVKTIAILGLIMMVIFGFLNFENTLDVSFQTSKVFGFHNQKASILEWIVKKELLVPLYFTIPIKIAVFWIIPWLLFILFRYFKIPYGPNENDGNTRLFWKWKKETENEYYKEVDFVNNIILFMYTVHSICLPLVELLLFEEKISILIKMGSMYLFPLILFFNGISIFAKYHIKDWAKKRKEREK